MRTIFLSIFSPSHHNDRLALKWTPLRPIAMCGGRIKGSYMRNAFPCPYHVWLSHTQTHSIFKSLSSGILNDHGSTPWSSYGRYWWPEDGWGRSDGCWKLNYPQKGGIYRLSAQVHRAHSHSHTHTASNATSWHSFLLVCEPTLNFFSPFLRVSELGL